MQNIVKFKDNANITEILKNSKTIAVVGISSKPERDSHKVGRYLKDAGFTVIPVNPGQSEVIGEKCYPSLTDIKVPVDIVDVFRRPEDMISVIEQVLQMEPLPKVVWMQLGIINHDAARLAEERGIEVIMDRCIKIDHQKLPHE